MYFSSMILVIFCHFRYGWQCLFITVSRVKYLSNNCKKIWYICGLKRLNQNNIGSPLLIFHEVPPADQHFHTIDLNFRLYSELNANISC